MAQIDEGLERFRELVSDALDSLPEEIAVLMDNVEIVVEDEPPRDYTRGWHSGTLLGLYHGIPLTQRERYGNVLPDKISIYRRPIERISRSADDIRAHVRETVLHEIGHHFGIGESRLRELGL